MQLYGATGAQSSILPALDTALGVQHPAKGTPAHLSAYLKEMRKYMPRNHRVLLCSLAVRAAVTLHAVVTLPDNAVALHAVVVTLPDNVETLHANVVALPDNVVALPDNVVALHGRTLQCIFVVHHSRK